MHRVGGTHAGAHAGAAHRDVGHARELVNGDATRRDVARFEEYLLDVDVLAAILAALLIATDNNDRRDIEPTRGHELTWRGLVAGRKAHHAVEQRAFNLDLNVARDQIARRQDV